LYKLFFKRAIDLLVASVLILVLAPILLIVALVTWFLIGNPIFIQNRIGRNEKIFRVFKFKTMTDTRDEKGELLSDKDRITAYGKFLRKTSLDELPQLFNIVLGDMSFIGPRPLLIRYLKYYTDEERIRHTVRPGITGLAQISGRNLLGWNERLQFDVEYVNRLSFLTDLKIIYGTFSYVLSSKDIVVDPESIMKNLDNERRID
jgi:undecaprenyl phosphate N,N'-diacetylbacillosamine 1-phosphate transferase